MDRAVAWEAFWDRPLVWLILEKVVLASVVPALVLLGANPMGFDWKQRIAAAIAVIAIGCFVAFTIEKRGATSEANPLPSTTGPSINRTDGPQSPIMPNNSGTVTITDEGTKPDHPPPKE